MQNKISSPAQGTNYAGVIWHSGKRKWTASIKRNGKVTYLGNFTTEAEALKARREAEMKIDGRYSNKRTRSAFDDFADAMYPTPADRPKPATGKLPKLSSTPTPSTSLTTEDLFAFINRNMLVRGSHVFWKREDGAYLVPHEWGDDLEILLSFNTQGERHVVRNADISWMLTHQRSIPEGHVIKHSDGKVTNRDPHNLWLVNIAD